MTVKPVRDFKGLHAKLDDARYRCGLINTGVTDSQVVAVLDQLVLVVEMLVTEVERTPIVEPKP